MNFLTVSRLLAKVGMYCVLLVAFAGPVRAQEDYLPGTSQLTPKVDMQLQPVAVAIPDQFDHIPDHMLNLPPGFSASVFSAEGLRNPRFMAFGPNGVLYLSNMGAGQILALPDRDNDGIVDETIIAARGFAEANNMVFHGGYMYVGDTHEIVRLRDADGDMVYEEREVLVALPTPGPCCSNGWHTTRTLAIDAINEKMYVGIGMPCDLCRAENPFQADRLDPLPADPEWGTILEFNLDGTGRRIFATGIRSLVGLAVHPQSNELWGDHNGYDLGGPNAPGEWIDIIRDQDFMGYPFVHGYQAPIDFTMFDAFNSDAWHLAAVRSQRLDKVEDLYMKVGVLPFSAADSLLIAKHKPPVGLVEAHLAPLGLHFYTGDLFPPRYQHAAFVALHNGILEGSLAAVPGHKVVALFSEPDGANARIGDFATGFVTGTTRRDVWGMPVGLATDGAGNLYVTSNSGNQMVLKIAHSRVSGEWDHNLPDAVAVGSTLEIEALVRLVRLVEDGQPPKVTVDLRAFGGSEFVVLEAVDDSTFRLEMSLPITGLTGPRLISIRIEQDPAREGYGVTLSKIIGVVPVGDVEILGDGLLAEWQVESMAGGQAPVFSAAGPVYAGDTAGAFAVEPERSVVNWEVAMRPPVPLSPFGYSALRFAFHPGDAVGPFIKTLLVSLDGSNQILVDLQRGKQEFRVDLEQQEWQVIEVPLDQLRGEDRIEGVRIIGNLTGTFYIDDMRLIAPESPPAETAVAEERDGAGPQIFALDQNFPNPFNSQTAIRFSLRERGEVKLAVYNLLGQQVAVLAEERREAGAYTLSWNGRDDRGRTLASGAYFYRLEAGTQVEERKLMLLR